MVGAADDGARMPRRVQRLDSFLRRRADAEGRALGIVRAEQDQRQNRALASGCRTSGSHDLGRSFTASRNPAASR